MGCNTNLHLVAAAIHNPRLVNSFSYANEKLILPLATALLHTETSAAHRNLNVAHKMAIPFQKMMRDNTPYEEKLYIYPRVGTIRLLSRTHCIPT